MSSQAVTLGRHSGAAVIGRPLDVRVQALLGPDDDMGSLCLRSEVLYGDVAVSSASVRTSVQRSAPDAQVSVRVQVSQPINEPIVTVLVHAGCQSSFSRRFVLLADPLSEPASSSPSTPGSNRLPVVVLPPLVAESQLGATGAGARGGDDARAGAASGSASADAAAIMPRRERAAPAPRSRPASVVRKPAPETTATTPRLQLDPVDLSLAIERDPVLKLSLSMLSEPATSEEERAAAGLLWKAINATPEDILRDTEKLAVLEAESKGLREKEIENKAALKLMEQELTSARYMTWLAYLLGGLLVLALLGLLWLSRRRKAERLSPDRGAWWAGAEKPPKTAGVTRAAALAARQDPSSVDIDLNLDDDESSFDGYKSLHDSSMSLIEGTDQPVLPTPRDAMGGAGSRSVATEELFDVQQQADFFISLGEHQQAIGVLKGHLAESNEPSPLTYLDLFRLYHQLGQHDEYESLREEFNHSFNAAAPPFEQYSDHSQGLEAHEIAFSRIQALWPQPRVLDVIEKSIFKEANDPDGEVFGLEAYRELLLLHAMAKDMIKRELAEANEHVDFQHTAIKPLKAAGHKLGSGTVVASSTLDDNRLTQPQDDMPQASPRLGLDVDLDALSEMSAFEASLPEVPTTVEPSAKPIPTRASVQEEGNLIDFEVLDFLPPDEPDEPKDKG